MAAGLRGGRRVKLQFQSRANLVSEKLRPLLQAYFEQRKSESTDSYYVINVRDGFGTYV